MYSETFSIFPQILPGLVVDSWSCGMKNELDFSSGALSQRGQYQIEEEVDEREREIL